MNIDLTGKRAVVAGGSRGIGRAIALAFAEAGAGVSICARGAEALAKARDDIARHGHTAHAATCDLADGEAIPRYIEAAAGALGGIDILVNNASGFGASDDEAGWAASIAVDLMATVRATRAALPHLEKSAAGAIINISSISGFRASARTPPYGAVKAAILEYTPDDGGAIRAQGHPRQLHRPRLDRISRRHLGARQEQQPEPLRRDPAQHPVRPAGPARGSGARRALPRLAARRLDHRPEHRRRWRPDAVSRETSNVEKDRFVLALHDNVEMPGRRIAAVAAGGDQRPPSRLVVDRL